MNRRAIRSFGGDEKGAVAATYAIALIGLIAIAGVAFDYGRLATMDSELQNGADQAALAGATQLDGQDGACARAAAAARDLIGNITLLANDGKNDAITLTNVPTDCSNTTNISFWQDKDKVQAATSDTNAHFIEVSVDVRAARYALTPIVGAFNSGDISAGAMAGLGSSICKVPPIMICSPNPSAPFNAAGKRGWGIQATGHAGGSSSWAPGDFGFLEVGTGQKADLERALAFKDYSFDCMSIDGTKPETGNAQDLFRAVNTRFDVYEDNGNPLNQCRPGGKCPAASNVVKDLIKSNTNINGNNACRIHNQGWKLPGNQFVPGARNATTEAPSTMHDANGVDAMGLPRDLCHYTSYVNGISANQCHNLTGLTYDVYNRYGNGNWARGDYWAKYHPASTTTRPSNWQSMTRYETYLWEQGLLKDSSGNTIVGGSIPHGISAGSGGNQYGGPICSTGSADGIDRRVLTLAIVKNCADLAGGSTAVEVDEWIDAFLVEPSLDARGNGANKDSIYVEVIGPASVGDSSVGGVQTVRRDVPYLVR